MRNLYITLLLIFLGFSSQAQELLTLEDAVKIALENNYDIKIAENNSKIDATNNNLANAGMLPSLNANFTNNNSQLDTKQTQIDGSERELDNAKNMNLTYGVSLDWTIFDGLSMFARKEQLNVL
ncbi:MAG: TolC family protein, partial [Flavobacterium sp.]